MNARVRTLLAMALGAAMFVPTAMAQQVKTDVAGQATVQTTAPTLPTQASDRAMDAVDSAMQKRDQVTDPKDQADAPMTKTEATKPMPPTSQGAQHAAPHSDVVQRDVWARLDTDGDGKISPTEADADTAFDADFASIDSDGDGFVSDTEYRSFAKASTAQGATDAAGHSAVVTRSTWARLDVNHDGKISATEADVDTSFDTAFTAMDSDGDGFVTDAEYRAHAKAQLKP